MYRMCWKEYLNFSFVERDIWISGVSCVHSMNSTHSIHYEQGDMTIRELMRQLLKGIFECQQKNVTHRDIEPENTFYTLWTHSIYYEQGDMTIRELMRQLLKGIFEFWKEYLNFRLFKSSCGHISWRNVMSPCSYCTSRISRHLMNESCHTCEWVTAHTWMSHVTHMNEWQDLFRSATWLIHVCGMTHSYVWHDSFICVAWLIHMCGMTHSYVWHDSFICVAWLIHICGMTHSYVWHDSFVCVIHSYVWHDSCIRLAWLLHVCDMTHSCVTWHTCMIHDELDDMHFDTWRIRWDTLRHIHDAFDDIHLHDTWRIRRHSCQIHDEFDYIHFITTVPHFQVDNKPIYI